jgi:hypothetical protein
LRARALFPALLSAAALLPVQAFPSEVLALLPVRTADRGINVQDATLCALYTSILEDSVPVLGGCFKHQKKYEMSSLCLHLVEQIEQFLFQLAAFG